MVTKRNPISGHPSTAGNRLSGYNLSPPYIVWLELVVDDAIVANTEGEIRRLKAMRELDPGDLAEIDAFLEFKRARKK